MLTKEDSDALTETTSVELNVCCRVCRSEPVWTNTPEGLAIILLVAKTTLEPLELTLPVSCGLALARADAPPEGDEAPLAPALRVGRCVSSSVDVESTVELTDGDAPPDAPPDALTPTLPVRSGLALARADAPAVVDVTPLLCVASVLVAFFENVAD